MKVSSSVLIGILPESLLPVPSERTYTWSTARPRDSTQHCLLTKQELPVSRQNPALNASEVCPSSPGCQGKTEYWDPTHDTSDLVSEQDWLVGRNLLYQVVIYSSPVETNPTSGLRVRNRTRGIASIGGVP
jgi:hypothetical protein